ncbi:MAG: phage tail tape measure protein, partial [Ruminococcus flavefaciens]|nr:phage tail tape measure protein [Ruminococcus flavefaciens]
STAVAGFGTAAVKSGMAFDATMSEVSAISGATGADFDALRDKALEMGAKTKFSASEAGEAMTYMAMAGWKSQDMISGISGIMDLAAASGEDLATTSDIVTDALTAFGLQASDSGHFADILAVASSNANTNVGMMGDTFKYVAPIAGAMGYSAEDTAVAIGLMANSGIKATQAGTSLRSIMTRLAKPTKESQTAMDALGLSITNSDGSMKSLNEIIGDMRIGFSGLTESQKASYAAMLGGQEAMSGLLAIVNASESDVQKLTAAIDDCNGAAAEMAAIMVDNLQGDLTLLGSAFESLQIAISDSLTPTLREFAQFGQKAMASLLEGFQGGGVSGFMSALSGIVTNGVTMLAQKAPEFAGVSIRFVAAFAEGILGAQDQILQAGGLIITGLIEWLEDWPAEHESDLLSFGEGLVEMIFSGFTKAGEAISTYIGDFVPLIAEAFLSYHESLFTVGMDILGAIGQGIIDNKDELQSMASETIANMVTALRDNAPDIIEGGIALLQALVGAIHENLPLILEAGAEIIGQLVAGIATAGPEVQAIIGVAVLPHILKIIDTVGQIGGAVGGVVQLVSGGINTVLGIGSKLMGGIKLLFGLIAAHPVIAVITAIVATVTLLWTHCEAFRDAVGAIWEAIVGFFQGAAEGIKAAFDGVVEFFSGVWEGIQNAFSNVVEFFSGLFASAWDAVQSAWSAASEFFAGVVDGIKGVFEGIGDFLGGLFTAAWELVQSAWDAAVEFFTGVGDGIRSVFETVTDFLGSAFSNAWDLVSTVWNAAISFFSVIWEGITGVFGAVAEFFGGVFSDAWNAVTSVWEGVTDFFGGIWEDIKGVFSDAWDKFSEIGGNIIKGIWDGISGSAGWLWDRVSGFFGGFVDGVKDFFGIHSPSTVFAEIGEFMMQGLSNGLDGESGTVDARMLEIVETMKSTLAGMTSIFSDIGQNAMSALSGSLGNAIGALQGKVANLMNGIANAAKAALKIHSPSRVFAGIGENMALGLAEGWDDQYSSIKRQIEGGMNFGTATVGLKTSGVNGSSGAQSGAQQPASPSGDTFIFNSPKALDPVSAAREMKKAKQQMALAY